MARRQNPELSHDEDDFSGNDQDGDKDYVWDGSAVDEKSDSSDGESNLIAICNLLFNNNTSIDCVLCLLTAK